MHLPKEKILFKSLFRNELENLLYYAGKALNDRVEIWTPFVSAQLIEEVKNKFSNLNDINLVFEGGFPAAERKRICFIRSEQEINFPSSNIPIKGIYLKGNFLFDRAKQNDFRDTLHELGVEEGAIGDIWLLRDRNCVFIC